MYDKPSRITLRSMFVAVSWMGACFGSWVYLINNSDWGQGPYPTHRDPWEGVLFLMALGNPFVAYQALRGRNRLGLYFGIFAVLFTIHCFIVVRVFS